MKTGEIVLTLILGIVVMPLLIFLAALLGEYYRGRKGMTPLPPQFVSQIVLLCILFAWLMTCCTVVGALTGLWGK